MPQARQPAKSSPPADVVRSANAASTVSPGDYQKAILRALADGPRTLKQLERDVARRLGVSDDSPVQAQLDAMQTAGVLTRRRGKFELSESGTDLAGFVPALS